MPVFSGIKWGVVGDSLSINLSTTRGNYPFVIDDEGTGATIKNVAISGTGYYDDVPFYTHVGELDTDTDVITIFGSTNDRSFHGSSIGERRYHYAEHQTLNSSNLLTGMTNPENDGLDGSGNYTGEGTLSAYVNRAIDAYHRRCPNAKIIIVPPICSTYNSNGNNTDPGTYNAAITVLKCAEGWIANKNAGSWLSLMNLWVSDFNTFVNDTDIKDVWLAENLGGTLDFRKKSPVILVGQSWTAEQAEAFANEYWGHAGGDSKSQVHANKTYNERYLAPKFANAICGVLGIDPADLPESLKLNNVNPPTTYTATFRADGIIVDTVVYEAGASVLPRVPAVPTKVGYTGAWEQYTLSDADITINAVYTANTYRVTFKADGVTVAVVPYQYGAQSITEPAVPEKEGYTGTWSPYTLGAQDSVSTAVYTPIEWEPTGYALSPTGPVMAGLRPDGTEAHEGLTPAGAVAFRRYAD